MYSDLPFLSFPKQLLSFFEHIEGLWCLNLMFKAQNSSNPPPCLETVKDGSRFSQHNCILISTKPIFPLTGKIDKIITQTHLWESTRRHFLPLPWCPHSFQGINTHAQTDCMVTPLTHSVQQAPDWPPALASGLLSLHFMTLSLLLASLCLMKTICKFRQTYAPILSEFIRRLYSVSLFFPLGGWPHHTPHSWKRSHLQPQNVFTNSNTSCLLQSPNFRSFFREVSEWSCPVHPTPAVFLSPHTDLNCGCAHAGSLMRGAGV